MVKNFPSGYMTLNQVKSLMEKNKYVMEPVGNGLSKKRTYINRGYVNPIHSRHDKGVQHKY